MSDPRRPPDAFDLLGLAPTLDLPRDAIERAYLTHARRLHPDLVGSDPRAQNDAQQRSSDLNRAARTLRDPEARANLLLARLGGPTKESDRSLPDGFLAQILETRMEIESTRGDPAARTRWEAWAQDQRAQYQKRCTALFAALGPVPDGKARQAIRRELNAWRYIERLIEQLDPGYNPGTADFAA